MKDFMRPFKKMLPNFFGFLNFSIGKQYQTVKKLAATLTLHREREKKHSDNQQISRMDTTREKGKKIERIKITIKGGENIFFISAHFL
jgi:hypothetical protein